MTVAELIQLLGEYSSDTIVIQDGYEGGYSYITCVETKRITEEAVNNAWYYGDYEEDENGREVIHIS